jgi:hypothetical protein
VSGLFVLSMAIRGVSVLLEPWQLGFVILAAANAVVLCALCVVVTAVLVWMPVYENQRDHVWGYQQAQAPPAQPELQRLIDD